MRQMQMFGAKVYNDQQYKDLMNSNYFPIENMRRSVAALKASGEVDLETMEYGQYQPVLSPLETWPKGKGAFWVREMGLARVHLTEQPNTTPLSNDQPNVVPLTRCALLDACIRKCFNSEPPIPMVADITEQPIDSPNANTHGIRLVWEYAKDDVPVLLRLTMLCPVK